MVLRLVVGVCMKVAIALSGVQEPSIVSNTGSRSITRHNFLSGGRLPRSVFLSCVSSSFLLLFMACDAVLEAILTHSFLYLWRVTSCHLN